MAITLLLEPEEQARLTALAQAKGMLADELMREAIDKILAEDPDIIVSH
jgi:predicted DNA-binding protein